MLTTGAANTLLFGVDADKFWKPAVWKKIYLESLLEIL